MAQSLLSGINTANAEARYQAFYPACAEGRVEVEQALVQIDELYRTADEAFRWNEDIVLADCLLDIAPPEGFAGLLAQLTKGKSEGPHASNKRALWLAMRLLNEQKPRHNTAAFAGLVGLIYST